MDRSWLLHLNVIFSYLSKVFNFMMFPKFSFGIHTFPSNTVLLVSFGKVSLLLGCWHVCVCVCKIYIAYVTSIDSYAMLVLFLHMGSSFFIFHSYCWIQFTFLTFLNSQCLSSFEWWRNRGTQFRALWDFCGRTSQTNAGLFLSNTLI